MEYAIFVKFLQRNFEWSKEYVYKSKTTYKPGDIVVVPTTNFYGIGEVTRISDKHKWKDNKVYKEILGRIPEISYSPEDKFINELEKHNVFIKLKTGGYAPIISIDKDGEDFVVNIDEDSF